GRQEAVAAAENAARRICEFASRPVAHRERDDRSRPRGPEDFSSEPRRVRQAEGGGVTWPAANPLSRTGEHSVSQGPEEDWPPKRPGASPHRPRESSDGTSHGESSMAVSFWPGPRWHVERFWIKGRSTHPSEAARLAGERIHS